jgi:hypothetical protein
MTALSLTPIADMVARMVADGVACDAIVAAVEAAELHARGSSALPVTAARRGTRLSDDWRPSEHDVAYAVGRGLTQERIAIEAEKFKNYWTSGRDCGDEGALGKDLAKLDPIRAGATAWNDLPQYLRKRG